MKRHTLTAHSFPNRYEGFCLCGRWDAIAKTPENLALAHQQHVTSMLNEPVERFVMVRVKVPYHMTHMGDEMVKRWVVRALNSTVEDAGAISMPVVL